ncbi:MAG: hypothetical protein JO117_01630 [Verrucomicrobia bacterium]|nr:hypothetical protein [Verrucomicrobiota bacterium]
MLTDWHIQARANRCAVTGREFADGEIFFTLLDRDPATSAFARRDLCREAWQQLRADPAAPQPFSYWRTKYTPPPPPAPEPLPKENAEHLLRRYLQSGQHPRACYILALMLERKRLLRPVHAPTAGNAAQTPRLLTYEHARTGEVLLIPDPELRLDQVEEVQREVAELLQPASVPVTVSAH